ncbi:hypothetical protein [Bifidobacterium oedipodis]|uniref:DUF4190 domain-containing protein n=1 Tax=Bifidobacterium oedipodis TaxID=2675322 RepID=A0A7Y0HS37_9BIFI|nr:hypothetical protein [Bifidobacterium sp. DSM 109957]NMM93586.1 hypothetical protein [Bifidobacterium sp. DSM 109957]
MSEPNVSQPNSQPEYGRYQQPEYGAMAGQFGPNYNPYVYGAPEAPKTAQTQQSQGAAGQYAQQGQQNPYGQQYQQAPQQGAFAGQNRPNDYTGQQRQGWRPGYLNGINLDDPNQNPLYGHWDLYAIISLVLALFFPVPVISALMGAMAMWRCRTFHMKGFVLGLIAVIVNVLYTIAVVWMLINGVDMFTLYQQMLSELQGGGGSNGDGTITA